MHTDDEIVRLPQDFHGFIISQGTPDISEVIAAIIAKIPMIYFSTHLQEQFNNFKDGCLDMEELQNFLPEDVFPELEDIAPVGTVFRANPEDGTDLRFWPGVVTGEDTNG